MDVRLYNGIFIVTTESLILQDEDGEKSFINLLQPKASPFRAGMVLIALKIFVFGGALLLLAERFAYPFDRHEG